MANNMAKPKRHHTNRTAWETPEEGEDAPDGMTAWEAAQQAAQDHYERQEDR
jgi:hypothetical protein